MKSYQIKLKKNNNSYQPELRSSFFGSSFLHSFSTLLPLADHRLLPTPPHSLPPTTTLMEGYLKKRGKGAIASLNKRWCVVKGTTMSFYKNKEDLSREGGHINLVTCDASYSPYVLSIPIDLDATYQHSPPLPTSVTSYSTAIKSITYISINS